MDHWRALGQLQQVGQEAREVDVGTLLGTLCVREGGREGGREGAGCKDNM